MAMIVDRRQQTKTRLPLRGVAVAVAVAVTVAVAVAGGWLPRQLGRVDGEDGIDLLEERTSAALKVPQVHRGRKVNSRLRESAGWSVRKMLLVLLLMNAMFRSTGFKKCRWSWETGRRNLGRLGCVGGRMASLEARIRRREHEANWYGVRQRA